MTEEPRPMRLFVAIDLPWSWKEALGTLQDDMRAVLEADEVARNVRMRWSRPEGIHLTLQFLGNVDPERAEAIGEALASAVPEPPAFSLSIHRAGSFSDGRAPRVVLATLGGDTKALYALQQRVETWLASAGFPRERRAYQPHLTLGRLPEEATQGERERVATLTNAVARQQVDAFEVREIVLMQSFLGPGGSRYERLLSVPGSPLQTPDQHL